MDLIIFLKDGSHVEMLIDRLQASGIEGNDLFIQTRKQGRIVVPLDSIDGFKIECQSGRTYRLHESQLTYLTTAVAILSKYSMG